jgi:hypothetical protein
MFLFNKKLVNLKSSQSAIEFVILLGFLLFSFTVFFLLINQNMSDKIRENTNAEVKQIGISVQDEINFAYLSSEGYSRNFKIPKEINGRDYFINITDNQVYVNLDDKYTVSLPVKNVSGNIAKGDNIIKKQGGIIKLNL